VAGAAQASLHPVHDGGGMLVHAGLELLEHGLRVGDRVERERGAVLRVAVPVRPGWVLILQVGGVEQEHTQQIRREGVQ
jgi:hypothetical protein